MRTRMLRFITSQTHCYLANKQNQSAYLGGILSEMNAALESIVEVSLAASPGQDLRLDDVLRAGKLRRDPGRLRLVRRHPELLHRHPIVLDNARTRISTSVLPSVDNTMFVCKPVGK